MRCTASLQHQLGDAAAILWYPYLLRGLEVTRQLNQVWAMDTLVHSMASGARVPSRSDGLAVAARLLAWPGSVTMDNNFCVESSSKNAWECAGRGDGNQQGWFEETTALFPADHPIHQPSRTSSPPSTRLKKATLPRRHILRKPSFIESAHPGASVRSAQPKLIEANPLNMLLYPAYLWGNLLTLKALFRLPSATPTSPSNRPTKVVVKLEDSRIQPYVRHSSTVQE